MTACQLEQTKLLHEFVPGTSSVLGSCRRSVSIQHQKIRWHRFSAGVDEVGSCMFSSNCSQQGAAAKVLENPSDAVKKFLSKRNALHVLSLHSLILWLDSGMLLWCQRLRDKIN